MPGMDAIAMMVIGVADLILNDIGSSVSAVSAGGGLDQPMPHNQSPQCNDIKTVIGTSLYRRQKMQSLSQ